MCSFSRSWKLALVGTFLGPSVMFGLLKPSRDRRFVCSACGQSVHRGDLRCSSCRTEFAWHKLELRRDK